MKKILQTGIFRGNSGFAPIAELENKTCLFSADYFETEKDAQNALHFALRLVEVLQDLPNFKGEKNVNI